MTSTITRVIFKPAGDMTVQELCILIPIMVDGMRPWQPWKLSHEWWASMPEHLKRHFEVVSP